MTSSESVAAQFLSWLAETSHSWLIVLDDLTDEADLDGLCPAGPAGRTLVTCADAAAVPGGMRVLPIGPFNSREALGYLTERLSANRGQRRRDRPDQRRGRRAFCVGSGQRGDRQPGDVVPELPGLFHPLA